MLSCHTIFIWDKAFNPPTVQAAFLSLARSYIHPFLLIMSYEKWKERSHELLQDVFSQIQVVGLTEHLTFRCGNEGDRLIYAFVASPHIHVLATLPPLDRSSPSVIDISKNRFGTRAEVQNEMNRFELKYNAPSKRKSIKHIPYSPPA